MLRMFERQGDPSNSDRTSSGYYSKRYAHSAWPAKWQGFLVLLYAQMVLFLVDEMKLHGDGGHCWDGWTLLKHVDFLLFWVCILKALELIFEALGFIFDILGAR